MGVLHVNVSILFDCRYSAVCYFQLNTCSNIRYSTLASPPFFGCCIFRSGKCKTQKVSKILYKFVFILCDYSAHIPWSKFTHTDEFNLLDTCTWSPKEPVLLAPISDRLSSEFHETNLQNCKTVYWNQNTKQVLKFSSPEQSNIV